MKKIFKHSMFMLLFLLAVTFCTTTAFAIDGVKLAYKDEEKILSRDLAGGLEVQKSYITTQNLKNQWNQQTYQYIDFSKAYSDTKIVSWTMTTPDDYKQGTIRDMATDFEKKNPGWLVVAGVNGGSFDNRAAVGTYEPTNMSLQNGDLVVGDDQSYIGSDGILKNGIIGFKEDGTSIVGSPTMGGYQLENITKGVKVEALANDVSSTVNTSFFTTTLDKACDLTGYTVYEGEYELTRKSDGGNIFVRGKITKLSDIVRLQTVVKSKFYVATKDENFKINIGDELRGQRAFTGEWSNVTNAVGTFVTQVLGDNIVYNLTDAAFHPRTILGFKEDGSFVMMVVDGRAPKLTDRRYGVTFPEEAMLMQKVGCVDAYNMDGGGSSEMIVREQNGTFTTINTPSDGTSRADGNGVFVVMRDPGFAIDNLDSTRGSLTIKRTDTLFSKDVSNIKATIGDVTKDMTGNSLTFDNLDQDSDYSISLTYDIKDGDVVKNSKYILIGQTKEFEYPKSGLHISDITKDSITVVKDDLATSSWIQNVEVDVSGIKHSMGNANTLTIPDLIMDTSYDVTFSYDVVDLEYNRTYHVTEDKFSIHTANYDVPVIDTFEEYKKEDQYLQVKYRYNDPSSVVTSAYLLYNGTKLSITGNSGKVEIPSFDLKASAYTIQLVIEYLDNVTNTTKSVKSTVLSYEKIVVTDPITPPTDEKKGCKKNSMAEIIQMISVVSMAFMLLRKRH